MNTKKWTTKDGRKIRIKDMDNDHLLNTVKFLERKHTEYCLVPPPCFQGEMAQFYADIEWENMVNSNVEDIFPIYGDMIDEARKRNIL